MQRNPEFCRRTDVIVNNVRRLLPPNKVIACHRCRKKKIKCSNGNPCQSCLQANVGIDCTYPLKTNSIKVPQRYLDELILEIDRLQNETSGLQEELPHRVLGEDVSTGVEGKVPQGSSRPQQSIEDVLIKSTTGHAEIEAYQASVASNPSQYEDDNSDHESVSSPALNYGPWFDGRSRFPDPVLIGETADAAFATRFRQVISNPDEPEPGHLLRLSYTTNEELMNLMGKSDVAWPSHQRSRFLIEAALKYLGRCHYIVQRDKITEGLGQLLANPLCGDVALRSKYWVLFALGELYVTKFSTNDAGYPGLEYFSQASKMVGLMDERPGLDSVETLLLLSLYSLALNRRYSAYILVGTAMRMGIVMGLHLNVPDSQLSDPLAREHRKRLFWTAYMFDRLWGSHLNLPAAIQDHEIEVGLPSLGEAAGDPARSPLESHGNVDFSTASIRLAGHLANVITSVYRNRISRKDQEIRLSIRVQRALQDLQAWVDELPAHLQVDHSAEETNNVNVVSLHLSFYQCIILTTRPILLHSLRVSVQAAQSRTPSSSMRVPASASALSEACAKCARLSAHLLTQSWIEGTFVTFDCFFTRYLFSSLTILAISSMLGGKENIADRESFREAGDLLKQLRDAGNCVAAEYCHHLEAMENAMLQLDIDFFESAEKVGAQPIAKFDQMVSATEAQHGLDTTMGMHPWTEPSLQTLLFQPELDLQFLEAAAHNDYCDALLWSGNGG